MKKLSIFSILLIILTITNSMVLAEEEYVEPSTVKAIVLEAGEAKETEDLYETIRVQKVKLKIASGIHKGEIIDVENHLSDNEAKSLLFAGIILGSLGAVMDVGMSISSSIEEIYNANSIFLEKNYLILV